MRARIAEAPEAQHLGADEDEVTVGQAVGRFEEYTGAVTAAEVADLEAAFFPRQLRMQRREELIVRETDVAFGPADSGRVLPALEPLQFGSHLGQQNQGEGVIGEAVGAEALFWVAVRGDDGGTQRTGRGGGRCGAPSPRGRGAGAGERGPAGTRRPGAPRARRPGDR